MNCDFGKWFASLDAVALLLEQSKIQISSILSSFNGEFGEGRARFCESSVVSGSFLSIFSGTFSSAVSISSALKIPRSQVPRLFLRKVLGRRKKKGQLVESCSFFPQGTFLFTGNLFSDH